MKDMFKCFLIGLSVVSVSFILEWLGVTSPRIYVCAGAVTGMIGLTWSILSWKGIFGKK